MPPTCTPTRRNARTQPSTACHAIPVPEVMPRMPGGLADRARRTARASARALTRAHAGARTRAHTHGRTGGTRASFYWSDHFAAAQQNLAQPEQERRLDLGQWESTSDLVYYLTNTPQGGPGRLVVSHPWDPLRLSVDRPNGACTSNRTPHGTLRTMP